MYYVLPSGVVKNINNNTGAVLLGDCCMVRQCWMSSQWTCYELWQYQSCSHSVGAA